MFILLYSAVCVNFAREARLISDGFNKVGKSCRRVRGGDAAHRPGGVQAHQYPGPISSKDGDVVPRSAMRFMGHKMNPELAGIAGRVNRETHVVSKEGARQIAVGHIAVEHPTRNSLGFAPADGKILFHKMPEA